MNIGLKYLLLVCFISALAGVVSFKNKVSSTTFEVPENWPKPVYDLKKNPLTEEGFLLGRKLFYDPNLSLDSSISCASCHLQYTAFTHVDHKVSHGVFGKKGTRNSPVLINLAWSSFFHWDGGVRSLDAQAINPLEHPAEMGNTLAEVIRRLNSSPDYKKSFLLTFGDSVITSKTFLNALAQYTVSLVSANSTYDKVMRGEVTFSAQEEKGYQLFLKKCNSCHTAPLFTNGSFASNGLKIDTNFNDVGRYLITLQSTDSMQFKVPTLRNIQFSFPYMHDGRYQTLSEVLTHYSKGIDLTQKHLANSLKQNLALSSNDCKDIIAFLYTLTDKEFLYNQRFSFPRE